jgi:hypothetical protein
LGIPVPLAPASLEREGERHGFASAGIAFATSGAELFCLSCTRILLGRLFR